MSPGSSMDPSMWPGRSPRPAEATLAALHLAVGGLECYRIEVPDYDDELSATLLAGYCFKGDGYLLGFYDTTGRS